MGNEPKISVIMAVYNAEKYIKEAISSVLDQTFEDFEFIIINDGSKDKSIQIIKSFVDKRIVLIEQENKGLANALNNGLSVAKGKYIARIDADDVCYNERLKTQFDLLENNPEYVAVGSNADLVDDDGNFIVTTKILIEWEEIKKRLPLNPFFHSSVMFSKEVAQRCGYYYEPIKQYYEDLILWNKMAKFGKLRNIKKALIKYRFSPNSISLRRGLSRKELILIRKILEGYFDSKLFDEIMIKRKKVDGQEVYNLILSKLYLRNLDVAKAREYLKKVLMINKLNIKAILLYALSTLNKRFLKFIVELKV